MKSKQKPSNYTLKPWRRDFWRMKDPDAFRKIKAEFDEDMAKLNAKDAKAKRVGNAFIRWGIGLTLLLTLPLIFTLILGPLGTLLGVLIALGYLFSKR